MTRRLILFTGGTGGVGGALVRALARDHDCALLYLDDAAFDRVRSESGDHVRGEKVDLLDDAGVGGAVQRLVGDRELGGVVLLAGGFAAGSIAETSLESWRRLLDLNLTTAFVAMRHAIPHLRRSGDARVVIMASDAARKRDSSIAAYTVSKAALNVLAEVARDELAGSRARINVLMPTAMGTPEMLASNPSADLVPLSHVVSTIEHLFSDAGASIDGATITLRR